MSIDLFTYQEIDYDKIKSNIKKHIGEWVEYFSPDILVEINNIVTLLEKHDNFDNILYYPDIVDVFRIYREVKPKDVEVLILSKEPYSDGNANGIAFGCDIKMTPSLKQLKTAIQKDTGEEEKLFTKSLEYLTKQKVMLLNCKLISTKDATLDEIDFDKIINATLEVVQKHNTNVVFMLWGNEAKYKSKYINDKDNLILKSEHPVFHEYVGTQWEIDHFTTCNKYKSDNNKNTIQWI